LGTVYIGRGVKKKRKNQGQRMKKKQKKRIVSYVTVIPSQAVKRATA
jgi:hypothetical protein